MSARLQGGLIALISALALAGFCWPLLFPQLGVQSDIAGYLAIALVGFGAVLLILVFDRGVWATSQLALLAGLAALAGATRVATSGVAGFELVFLVVILAGISLGPRFGMLVGVLSILLSSVFFGGLGPWTAFQTFAVGWVGAGAGFVGLVAKTLRSKVIISAGYAVLASYLFGLIMNLWFWPFATGPSTSISFSPEAPLAQNLSSFLLYSLTTSTIGWDSVRAISLAVAIALVGRPILQVLSRVRG
jgi:hypothetical protein